MHILGIETSCDETSAAIVKDGRDILSNVFVSSLKEHKKYGGIIPEIASRRQMESIHMVVEDACDKARISLKRIQTIAVTQSPGLIGSLLVGLSFARALSFALQKPLIEVDHIKAHLYATSLRDRTLSGKKERPLLPAIGLIVSGGHTSLYLIKNWSNFISLGRTRDDAAGEAFDKVARILHLGYPGGPVIDKISQKAAKGHGISFHCADLPGTFDFSFSGIKTAVLYYQQKHNVKNIQTKAQVAQAFQDSVVSVLVQKCSRACQEHNIHTLIFGGGVAANTKLRHEIDILAKEQNITVFFPPLALCMDNAAMVAGYAYHLIKR